MPSIKISKTQLPDPPEKIVLYTNDGKPLGILRFTATTHCAQSIGHDETARDTGEVRRGEVPL